MFTKSQARPTANTLEYMFVSVPLHLNTNLYCQGFNHGVLIELLVSLQTKPAIFRNLFLSLALRGPTSGDQPNRWCHIILCTPVLRAAWILSAQMAVPPRSTAAGVGICEGIELTKTSRGVTRGWWTWTMWCGLVSVYICHNCGGGTIKYVVFNSEWSVKGAVSRYIVIFSVDPSADRDPGSNVRIFTRSGTNESNI